ncbi:MAG: 5'-nucleotidase, lipoprotein e(P4) family [Bacteroidales bacterium]
MRTIESGLITITIILLSFSGCKDDQHGKSLKTTTKTDTVFIQENLPFKNEYMVSATLYQQKAAEYRALCYQSFNLAALMLDKDLSDKRIDKHRVVIVDIDETVLDNSPFQGKSILENSSYPKFWNEWCSLAKALPVPGASSFLQYAKANGVGVYYITNRDESLRVPTLRNLVSAGFPFADDTHLIMKTKESSKEGRRQAIAARNHIALLIGDNLADFSYLFDKQTTVRRMDIVDSLMYAFGPKFIVLPNAMYGDWEAALYSYDWSKPDSTRALLRLNSIKGF